MQEKPGTNNIVPKPQEAKHLFTSKSTYSQQNSLKSIRKTQIANPNKQCVHRINHMHSSHLFQKLFDFLVLPCSLAPTFSVKKRLMLRVVVFLRKDRTTKVRGKAK
jgi:hypothetical protein